MNDLREKKFKLKWIAKGNHGCKLLEREEVLNVFKGLAQDYPDNNTISQKLLEVLPELEWILIDKDINATQKIPFITFGLCGKTRFLKIPRHHKIVWGILLGYTQ